ncbi:MAG: ribonuclease HII [Bacillota bacterium]|jgi:ribonuclease HII|nr:ribonuclease HII [Bacillota bacterium]HHU43654.1 ribonuclease HII [Clostridiales bacterium]
MNLLRYEKELLKRGLNLICGIDEAGRGPLAGPVMVGAAIMDMDNIIPDVDDSKKLSEKERERLYDEIVAAAIGYATVAVDCDIIDEINILNATKRGMRAVVDKLFPLPDILLVDAVEDDFSLPSISIIKGDAKSYSIAAASILAKVERDRLMRKYAEIYPEYGFEKHKGYPTKLHIERLKKYGPCPIHRKSFIKNFFD